MTITLKRPIAWFLALVVCASIPLAAHAQSARFDYEDGVLWMNGEIDRSTPRKLSRALQRYPDAQWIALEYVPGSNDDEANLQAARLVRQAGLSTIVLSDSLIASGGTDFFLAGVNRVVRPGACIGVHAWSDDSIATPASQLPRNHPEHSMYLQYYRELGVPDKFYWFTLQAASADGMHYMSQNELNAFGVATAYDGQGAWNLSSCQYR
ncbi:MAG: alpha/beta hydrolase [Roseobacter sp.]